MFRKSHDSTMRARLLGGAAAVTGAALAAAAPAGMAAAQDGQEAAGQTERIVVTGSRLIRSDLSAPSPTTVIGQDAIQNSGATTIETVLYEFPQLSAGNTSSVNSGGGSGVLTANLRGLGATRTLTLVNGRRFIPANGAGAVDLATIPSALVERVEVITGGASAVYGSDAIAGAVNFILRDDIDGIETSYRFGQTDRGDGTSHTFDLTFGTPFQEGRGQLTLHGNYTERDPVMMQDREFSSVPLSATLGISGSGNIPGGRVDLSAAQLAMLDVGQGPGVIPTGADGCSSEQSAIRFGEGGQAFRYCSPEDLYNYADGNYLLRPFERMQFVGLASYEIAPNVEAYGEFHYVNAKNAFQQASDSLSIRTPGQTFFEVVNYASNPALSGTVRDFFTRNSAIFDPDATGDARIAGGIHRRLDELGLRNFSFERATTGATGGLRGDFDLGGNRWNWDVFAQYQRSRTDEVVEGMMSAARMGLGLDTVVDGDGNAVCATQALGCVPVDPFGLDSLSPEAAAFITPARSSREIFERTVVGGSLAGELFAVPAGMVSTAVGFEHRKDDYEYMPGATDLAQEYGTASRGITQGGFDVSEVFAEARVPVLAGLPLIEELAIEGAVRHSEYSNFGGATTWKIGAEWVPVDWLRVRSAFNVANRAPSISELFSPVSEGFAAGTDRCAASSNPTQAERDLCVQQGVPASEINTFEPTILGFNQLTGGNPDLEEETSETFTIGAVIQPPMIRGLNLTVDYFRIEVDNAVATLSAQNTINTCFELLDIDSAPCQAIVRIPQTGQIFEVRASNSNIGSLTVEGVDVAADYGFTLPDGLSVFDGGADLTLMANLGWLLERTSQVIGASPIDCAGYFGSCTVQGQGGSPGFKAIVGAAYASGPLTARVQWRHLGALDPLPSIPADTPVVADAVNYFDVTGAFRIREGLELFGGVDNVFDKQPPVLTTAYGGDANTDASLYDVIGRRYFVGVRASF